MAVNVDTVYKTVLYILNKEQRGYMTPDEFNKVGQQVQLEIFDNSGNSDIRLHADNNSYITNNLGVGTTTPSEKLELGTGGKIKLTSNDSVSGSIVVLAGDSRTILSTENDSATGDPLQFVLKHNFGSTELINRRGDLILSSSGDIVSPTSKVGIGTTSPDEKLSVTGGNIELTVSGKIGFNVSDDIPVIQQYKMMGQQLQLLIK